MIYILVLWLLSFYLCLREHKRDTSRASEAVEIGWLLAIFVFAPILYIGMNTMRLLEWLIETKIKV